MPLLAQVFGNRFLYCSQRCCLPILHYHIISCPSLSYILYPIPLKRERKTLALLIYLLTCFLAYILSLNYTLSPSLLALFLSFSLSVMVVVLVLVLVVVILILILILILVPILILILTHTRTLPSFHPRLDSIRPKRHAYTPISHLEKARSPATGLTP